MLAYTLTNPDDVQVSRLGSGFAVMSDANY